MAGEESVSAAILVDHASFLLPSGEPGRLSPAASQQVVTLLNWAASPHVKRLNMAVVLMDESAAALSERITSNPYVSDIEVPMPDEAARGRFLRFALEGRDIQDSFPTIRSLNWLASPPVFRASISMSWYSPLLNPDTVWTPRACEG